MKIVDVEVTQEDIDGGKQSSAFSCPVALALTRACGFKVGVCMGYADFFNAIGHSKTCAKLPPLVNKWYKRYDAAGPEHVRPIAFKLAVPDVQ